MNQMISTDTITNSTDTLTGHKPQGACIAKDTVIKGEISKCKHMEVYGQIEGKTDVGHVIIHQDGKVEGTLTAASAEIHGTFEGDISVKGHLAISRSGSVKGKVQYGEFSVEEGAELSADIGKVQA